MKPDRIWTVPGKTIHVFHDPDPMSPRESDTLGEIIGWNRRYTLSDDKKSRLGREDAISLVKSGEVVEFLLLQVNEYDGSVSSTVGTLKDLEDSHYDGMLFARREKVLKEYGLKKRVSARARELTRKVLIVEAEVYSQYGAGDVWGFEVVETGDACWGFFGDDDKNGLLDHVLTEEEIKIAEKA